MAVTTAKVKKVVKVAGDIIYAQEGDYGSVNKNDNSHGMSIGKCQWNAYWGRALPLLQTIVKADGAQAKEILGDALYKEVAESKSTAWDNKARAATAAEAEAISQLLTTDEGKAAQDDLAETDITACVKNGVKVGLVSLKALAYYADLENQGGSTASKRVATAAAEGAGSAEKVGLDKIHAYALKDSVMGQYESRRAKVYEAVKAAGTLTDVAEETAAGTTAAQNTATATQNGGDSLEIGAGVTFIGGGVYKSSTAAQASTTKNVTSTCKVTAINEKGSHPYHCISQDGKGVYGWVNADSLKETSTAAQDTAAGISKGDTVTFAGGAVYKSSTAAQAGTTKNVTSTCKVTAINEKGSHPYHCISQDGKGVYGWVDKASVK